MTAMTIRRKLVVMFLAAALAPMLLIGALAFWSFRNTLEAARLVQLQDVAALKAARIEGFFADLKEDMALAQSFHDIQEYLPLLVQLSRRPDDPEFRKAKRLLDEQLRGMQALMNLSDLMLVDPSGRIVYSSNPKHIPRDFLRQLPDPRQKAFREGRTAVSLSDAFFDSVEDGRPHFLITGPARGHDGEFIGVIAFEVAVDLLRDLTQDLTGLGVSGEILLGKKVEDQAVFLIPLRNDGDAALKKRLPLGGRYDGPMQEAVQGRTSAGRDVDYRGEEVIAAWRPLPSLGWGIVTKIDAREAFAGVTGMMRWLAAVLVFVAVLAVLLAVSLARSIAEPIVRLACGVEVVGRGDLDFRVGLERTDEIGQLSRTFDAMTLNLKSITASRDELDAQIKERVKAETELKRSNENLEQFAYVASHDLQEPLRMMASYSELLVKRYKGRLDADADEFVGYIVEGAKRMQRLIGDLLSYSRVGRPGRTVAEIDCGALLGEVTAMLAPSLEKAGAAVTHDALPVVRGNESEFVQLFQNLIGNAVKFRGPQPPLVHVGATRRGGDWVFSVADNGIGIEPEYKDRIFLIFQRLHTREKYPGTGIGLSICKKIVETQGGRIWVESVPGKGATFFFTIPAREKEQEA